MEMYFIVAHHKDNIINILINLKSITNLVEVKVPYEVERKVPFPVKIFIPQPYAVDKHKYGHHHHSHHTYDHHSDNSNRYPQQIAFASSAPSQSSEQSSSNEYSDYLPKPEHLRSNQNQQHTTKLFSPYQNQASAGSSPQQDERPYSQQHQLHHQQQYVAASMRKEMLVRNRMKFDSDEDGDSGSSTEFRPMMGGHSMEDGSSAATNNVETVVPPPPSLASSAGSGSLGSSSVRPFHINVPERLPHAQALTTSSDSVPQHSDAAVSTHNQYQQNIEIPVHVFRLQLQPIEPGQGFAVAS